MPGSFYSPRDRAIAIANALAAQRAAAASQTPLNTPINPVPPTQVPLTPSQSQQLPPPPFMGAPTYSGPHPVQVQPAATPAADDNTDSTDTTDSAPKANAFDATGKTDTFGSWFNKRSSSDALTAFAGAMLKAPTFLQGLGDGALAVNAVDRQNRMPTPFEIAKANITDYNADGTGGDGSSATPSGRGQTTKIGVSGFDANHKFWQNSFDQGKQVWTSEDGATQAFPPSGFIPSTQSGVGTRTKASNVYQTTARDKADQAQQNMGTYDNILETASHANVGSGSIEKMYRTLSSIGGVDIGSDQNLSDQQVLLKNTRKLELNLAQGQKGLGQFTEMERQIVKEALPSMDTAPATVFRVTAQMKLRDQLDTELYNDYMDMPASRRPSFEEYAYDKRREQAKEYPARYKAMVADELAQYPEYQKYMKGGSAPAVKSILDEADAIVK